MPNSTTEIIALKPTSFACGFGRHNKEIILAPRTNLNNDRRTIEKLRGDKTTTVMLTDDLDVSLAITELDAIRHRANSDDFGFGEIYFPFDRQQRSSTESLRRKFQAVVREKISTKYGVPVEEDFSLEHFTDDVFASADRLKHIIDFNDDVTFFLFYDNTPKYWHKDSGITATRSLAAPSTKIALEKHTTRPAKDFLVSKAVQTEQGLTITRAKTVHAGPGDPRWVYVLEGSIKKSTIASRLQRIAPIPLPAYSISRTL